MAPTPRSLLRFGSIAGGRENSRWGGESAKGLGLKMGAQTAALRARAQLVTTLVMGLAAVLVILALTIVNVALDAISTDFDASLAAVQWVVNGFSLGSAALLLSAGSLADRLGRRGVFQVGMAVFTIASAACAIAPNAGLLIAARIVQGIGSALVMGSTIGIIAGVYDGDEPRRRQTAIGIYSGMAATAAAVGPFIGGVLVDLGGWRMVFIVNIPLGIAIMIAVVAFVGRQPLRAGTRLDLLGAVLVAGSLFALNYGVLTGTDVGWNQLQVIGTLAIGVLLLVAFVIRQAALGDDALLDLGLFRIPTFTAAGVLAFSSRMVSLGLFPFLILWLGGIIGQTPLQIGLTMVVISLPQALLSLFSGVFARLMSARVICGVGSAIVGVGLLWASAAFDSAGEWTAVLPGLVLTGIGSGIVMPQLIGLAVGVVPADRAGMASGLSNTFFPLGTSTGVALYGAVMAAVIGNRIGDEDVAGDVAAGHFDALDAGSAAATGELVTYAEQAFVEGLSTVAQIAGFIALASAVLAVLLIRQKDVYAAQPTAS